METICVCGNPGEKNEHPPSAVTFFFEKFFSIVEILEKL